MNKYRIASLIIYPLIAIGSFCLFFFVKGNYYLSGYIDPLFFAGIMVMGCGLLTLMAFFGAFDFVVYGFRTIFKHMKRDYNNSLDEYPDYSVGSCSNLRSLVTGVWMYSASEKAQTIVFDP